MKQTGFTLIEMITVIILLAVLSATALPKFINLSDEAKAAAVAGMADNITAQGKLNFAAWTLSGVFNFGSSTPATSTKVTVISGTNGACATLLIGAFNNFGTLTSVGTGTLPGNLSIVSDQACGADGVSIGSAATCTIENLGNPNISAVASVICTGS